MARSRAQLATCQRKPQAQRLRHNSSFRQQVRDRLREETGRIEHQAPHTIALAYPSPYAVGMSSLGCQTIYRTIQTSADFACERVFAPDRAADWNDTSATHSYESNQPMGGFPVVAFSIAYEGELAGLVRMLEHAGIPCLRDDRDDRHPLVIAGGPLTFSNPTPLGPFVDAIVYGEADELILPVLQAAFSAGRRQDKWEALAALPHVVVPAIDGETAKPLGKANLELLPAWAPMRTPNTELRNMFLLEAVRGCSRGCTYCVMRRSTNAGMRIIAADRILQCIPDDATRVGLVGASVSDHPHIAHVVNTLADRGVQVGLSSLRADKLREEFVTALKRGGYRTITTAMDGASERLRTLVDRRTTVQHLMRAAQNSRAAGMERLKLYLMVGLPTETPDDIEEGAELVRELSRLLPVSLGVAPFCPKKNTPLATASFAGVSLVDKHLALLRRKLAGRADVRATSARWAWVESVLAQGGWNEGLAVLEAVHNGGSFAAYRNAFEKLGHRMDPPERKTERAKTSLPLMTGAE